MNLWNPPTAHFAPNKSDVQTDPLPPRLPADDTTATYTGPGSGRRPRMQSVTTVPKAGEWTCNMLSVAAPEPVNYDCLKLVGWGPTTTTTTTTQTGEGKNDDSSEVAQSCSDLFGDEDVSFAAQLYPKDKSIEKLATGNGFNTVRGSNGAFVALVALCSIASECPAPLPRSFPFVASPRFTRQKFAPSQSCSGLLSPMHAAKLGADAHIPRSYTLVFGG